MTKQSISTQRVETAVGKSNNIPSSSEVSHVSVLNGHFTGVYSYVECNCSDIKLRSRS